MNQLLLCLGKLQNFKVDFFYYSTVLHGSPLFGLAGWAGTILSIFMGGVDHFQNVYMGNRLEEVDAH